MLVLVRSEGRERKEWREHATGVQRQRDGLAMAMTEAGASLYEFVRTETSYDDEDGASLFYLLSFDFRKRKEKEKKLSMRAKTGARQ